MASPCFSCIRKISAARSSSSSRSDAPVSMTTAVAIYFLIWWVVLFAVLPWGIRSQAEGGEISPATDPGAPSLPQLGRKALWTTVIASVVFAAFYAAYPRRWLTLDDLAGLFGLLR